MQSNPKSYQKNKKDIENSLIILLSCNKEYSYVTTIYSLLEQIASINPLFKANINEVSRLNIKENDTLFESFSKTIVCFSSDPNYNYELFLSQLKMVDNIEINSNVTLLNMLADAILTTMKGDNSSYIQCTGLRLKNISESNDILLKNYSNRIIHSRTFEMIRLFIGDYALMFIFRFCSLFVYEKNIKNYIQVLGYSLKEIMVKSLNLPSANRYNSNFYFQKVFTASNNTSNFSSNNSNSNNKIPNNPQYIVERTKIYYCPNFNRKLGFFKKLKIKECDPTINNQKNFLFETFGKICGKVEGLIPIEVKKDILNFINQIAKNINVFNYSKELFQTCPIIKDWKKLKTEIKEKIRLIEEADIVQEDLANELMEKMKILINTNISYDRIFKFSSAFIHKVIPKELLGKSNMKVLLEKMKMFISMNRFETFNKINLFDHKEFSFTEMKWLTFKRMSKKKYSEYGILLKNYIMKSIIHWIFDFIMVQLFRSHFFITEKQGDHFRSFYFHKVIYDLIIKICYIKYIKISNQYRPTTYKQAFDTLSTIDSAPGRLRLMPKPSTMRPITSFKKKTIQTKSLLKSKLFEIQKIFKYIQCKMQNNNKNCVVFDYKEIIKRLMNIKLKMVKCQSSQSFLNYNDSIVSNNQQNANINNVTLQKYLSYVTMDIEACYDNIDINLLNQFLDRDDTISPTYVTGILYVLIPKLNKLKNSESTSDSSIQNSLAFKECFDIKLIYLVCDLKEYIQILDCLQKREDISYSNCILYLDSINGINYKSKAQFIPTVRNIVNNNFIKFNRTFLKQIKGIPQGLSVSSFLCNLFFYEIEQGVSHEIQKEMIQRQSLLLRFMDDYLCISTDTNSAVAFRTEAIQLSKENKFRFNLKKSQSNVLVTTKTPNPGNTNKFNWNGIFFELNQKFFFNLIYDAKVTNFQDLNEYTKLINVNLPILKNIKDYSWLIKKINSVLFSGHPWIYFLSTINEKKILEKNLKTFIRFFLYKLIVLIRRVMNTSLQPSQKEMILILDTSIMKMFSFFDTKIFEIENRNFFVPYSKFHKLFYIILFKNYFTNDKMEIDNVVTSNINYNSKMIKQCPLLFKAIKRKIERLKITEVINIPSHTLYQFQRDIDAMRQDNKTNVISSS